MQNVRKDIVLIIIISWKLQVPRAKIQLRSAFHWCCYYPKHWINIIITIKNKRFSNARMGGENTIRQKTQTSQKKHTEWKKNKKTKLRSRLGQQESIGSTLKNHQSHTIEHRVIKGTTPTVHFLFIIKKKGTRGPILKSNSTSFRFKKFFLGWIIKNLWKWGPRGPHSNICTKWV